MTPSNRIPRYVVPCDESRQTRRGYFCGCPGLCYVYGVVEGNFGNVECPDSYFLLKETYGAGKINREVPSSRELLADKSPILKAVCKAYEMKASEVLKMRRGKINEARNKAIYLTRKLRRGPLKEVDAQFDIDNDSTVRSVMERMEKRLSEDRKFLRRVDKIAESINTS